MLYQLTHPTDIITPSLSGTFLNLEKPSPEQVESIMRDLQESTEMAAQCLQGGQSLEDYLDFLEYIEVDLDDYLTDLEYNLAIML